MNKLLTIILLLNVFVLHLLEGQDIKFGSLRPSDFEMSECAFEKEAPAVVLFDLGNSWFVQDDRGFVLCFERHVRIKIFDESAFNKGEFEIALFQEGEQREVVKDIQGYTFNVEGGRLEQIALDLKNVYQEDINEYWYMKKFAMPQVKEGSIVDVKYSVYSHYYDYFKDWEFQTDIPVLYSEYRVNMIPFFSYRYRLQGATKFDHYKKYEKKGLDRVFVGIPFNDMVYEFGMRNIPSFNDESFISSRNDYLKKIDFQLSEINYPSGYSRKYMNTWPSLAEELLDNDSFGRYLKRAQKWGEKTFAHLQQKPQEEQLEEVLNYMKQNYSWNNYSGKFAQYSLKEFNSELNGNIGNINLSTIGALRSLGLSVSPVIISTRDNGKVSDSFPYSKLFNYVLILVEVNGTKRLVDATQDLCPNNLIPSNCINGKGFIVEEDSENWVTITNAALSMEEINLAMSVNVKDNQVEGVCKARSTGYAALSDRQDYYASKEKFEEKITKRGVKVTSMEADDLFDSPLSFKYAFNFSQSIDRIDEQLIIAPFANLSEHSNPFIQEERTHPVDLVYLRGNRLVATIEVPEGYNVQELPGNKKLETENVSFNYMVHQKGALVQVVALYNFKKQTYPANTYKELKQFMQTVTSKINAKIVLVKKDDNLVSKL
ncbi:hypothetical protein [Carboxylicivirga taeanensis]|uniref:hypothetical protein n=1 Tax=Carboxylicivirga taeanensis TaxID=1416875 RepID=UPI003F6E2B8E